MSKVKVIETVVAGIEAKEVQAGFHSIHVLEPNGAHWSNGTIAASSQMYGPFTPAEDESLLVTKGILLVVFTDPALACVEVREGGDQWVSLPAGKEFFFLARTSVAYICVYPSATTAEAPPEESDGGDGDGNDDAGTA